MLVMDEADEMLNEGFKEQIYNIFMTMPHNIQVQLKRFIVFLNDIPIIRSFFYRLLCPIMFSN